MHSLDELISAAQHGDLEAFGSVVERFQASARATALGMLGDVHLAEDAAQEAFLEAYRSLEQLREPAAFAGWFRRIVVKRADRLRRAKLLNTVPLEQASELGGAGDPAALVEALEQQRALHAAVHTLSDAQRLPLLLFYMAGYTQREIAALLGLDANTVKQRLWQARKQLRAQLQATLQPPSGALSMAIRFLLAVRTGNVAAVEGYLDIDAGLANARERWDDATARRLGLGVAGSLTALHRAALEGYPAVLRVLLAYDADHEARTRDGQSALHLAVLNDNRPAVALLVAEGADPNARADTGMSPLHYAALRQRHACAELLLAAGCQVELRDRGGRTAHDWALHKHDDELARMLERAPAVNQGSTR